MRIGKRVCAALLGILLAVGCGAVPIRAEEGDEWEEDGLLVFNTGNDWMEEEPLEALNLDEELPEVLEVISQSDDSIPAKSAILLDQASGQVLYEKNADEQLPPASVTKIMTMLLVVEALDSGRISLEDMVSASEHACSMGGSQIWLKPGEEMSVNDLLKAVSISSANDASVALAEHVAGTEETFVDLMNRRAQELGMENTHFLNTNGLDEKGHLTTARDIAIMSRELMKHTLITDYTTVWMDSLRNGETELVNTNKLVRFYGGTTGLKTGTTSGAGSCLSATATRDGLGLVAVVMGCATSDDRFSSARSLLDYGFANYTCVDAPAIDDQLVPVKVLRGVGDQVTVTYDAPGQFVVEKQKEDSITQEITLVDDVEAPVHVGQILGKAQVIIDGQVVHEYDLKAADEVARITVPKAFRKLVVALFTLSGGEKAPPEASDGTEALPGEDPAATEESASQGEGADSPEPCKCGMDTCYCAEIGDICGCTREE